jgi:hypothetical protein
MIRPGSNGTPRQYIRWNPEIDFPIPRLDDIGSVPKLQAVVKEVLTKNKAAIRDIAYRLVASTFFFEKEQVIINEGAEQFACKGMYQQECLKVTMLAKKQQAASLVDSVVVVQACKSSANTSVAS